MNRLLKILYGLAALALGIFLSVSLIKMATSHDSAHVEFAPADTLFPDYVEMMNTQFDKFENRKDHFHQTAKKYMLPLKEQENCLTCHSLWPHKKNTRTRAFNNQHSRYMTCMVCHIDEQAGRPVSLEWYDFGIDNLGPYGLARISGDGLTGADNYISKIMPVIIEMYMNHSRTTSRLIHVSWRKLSWLLLLMTRTLKMDMKSRTRPVNSAAMSPTTVSQGRIMPSTMPAMALFLSMWV